MGWVILGVVVVLILAFLFFAYNGLVTARNRTQEAWSEIDVELKRRHDLIPNLVNTVQGYMGHEREVLERVTAARTAYQQAQTMEQKGAADDAMRGALGRLFAVAEGYPQLKADASFRQLQERISSLEEEIADRREFFNHSVNAFNVRIEQVPDVFLARMMGLSAHALFRVSEEDKQDVQVRFS